MNEYRKRTLQSLGVISELKYSVNYHFIYYLVMFNLWYIANYYASFTLTKHETKRSDQVIIYFIYIRCMTLIDNDIFLPNLVFVIGVTVIVKRD